METEEHITLAKKKMTEELRTVLQVIAFTVEYEDCTHSNRRARERHKGISSQIIYRCSL